MLGSYASRDHRAIAIKQRRLDQNSRAPRQERDLRVRQRTYPTWPNRFGTLRIRGRDKNAATSLLERR